MVWRLLQVRPGYHIIQVFTVKINTKTKGEINSSNRGTGIRGLMRGMATITRNY